MISPFCWSRGGGDQVTTALEDVTLDTSILSGYPLGAAHHEGIRGN
jgi:hypothetical protein